AYPDRLYGSIAAGDRDDRQVHGHAGEEPGEAILVAERERWPEDRPVDVARATNDLLAGRLRAQVHRGQGGRIRVGDAQRRNVQQAPDAGGPGGVADHARNLDMRLREPGAVGLAAAAMEHADEIDDGIDAMEQALDRAGSVDVRLHQVDGRQQDQVAAVLVS